MILKWIFDRVVALFGLLCLWPVLLVVVIMVKVKMPGGPVFFVQKRVGKDGKLFLCHKFRTMTVNHNGSTVSVAGDSRITLFGATLRHYKLDELPGLWDVLIGNMSFVGPRPDVPGYADRLEGDERDVLKLRGSSKALGNTGDWKMISNVEQPYPLIYLREADGERYCVAVNPSAKKVAAKFPAFKSGKWEIVIGDKKQVKYKAGTIEDRINMSPVSAVIFKINK